MKKILTTISALLIVTSIYGEEVDKKESKWTGQLVPRIEVEDTNNYGGNDAHPLWYYKLNGKLQHKDYPNWTFIYELRLDQFNASYIGDAESSKYQYRVYPGIMYSKNITEKLNLKMTVRDRWQMQETDSGETLWKVNSYRIAPGFKYQITKNLDFHGELYLMKEIYYDRTPEKSKDQRNSKSWELTGLGFTYTLNDRVTIITDYWEEGWNKEHKEEFTGDKFRHQQVRPRIAYKLNEKNTLELYGRIQVADGQITRDNVSGKVKVDRDRYGFDMRHKLNDSFNLNWGFAVEPAIKEIGYDGSIKKRDWYYYTGSIVYNF